jgi:hypothetical protein
MMLYAGPILHDFPCDDMLCRICHPQKMKKRHDDSHPATLCQYDLCKLADEPHCADCALLLIEVYGTWIHR